MSGSANLINTNFPLVVGNGGTGNTATATTYGVQCAGTTSTGHLQSIAALGTAGQALTSNGASALPTFQAATGGGIILQAVQTIQTTQTTFSPSGSPQDIGLNVSITPSSISSNILILVSVVLASISSNNTTELTRNSTPICINTDATVSNATAIWGSFTHGAVGYALSNNIFYIDSPSTTSSTTYGIWIYPQSGGGTFRINSADNSGGLPEAIGAVSTIIAIELAG